MATPPAGVTAVLATLRERWGEAAPRWGGEVAGALALAPAPLEEAEADPRVAPAFDPFGAPFQPQPRPFEQPLRRDGRSIRPDDGRVLSTGFPALDAILGPGGVPRDTSLALRGDHSSGKTTLALRLAAEAQVGGAIVAWLDLAGSFDPVEAVARGVRLEWLVVLTPTSLDEGLSMAGALVQGRAVDLLIVDLPPERGTASGQVTGAAGGGVSRAPGPDRAGRPRAPGIPDRLHRLTALARRTGTLLVVLEPPGLPAALDRAVGEIAGLRLELVRQSWIRLGRDVVGQRTEAVIARNRFGPPDRRAELRILYADGGERDACLDRAALLAEPAPGSGQSPGRVLPGVARRAADPGTPIPGTPIPGTPTPGILALDAPIPLRPVTADATPPPLLAPPASPARRTSVLHTLPGRTDRPRRAALDRRSRPRHGPGRSRAGRPARDAARERASARA